MIAKGYFYIKIKQIAVRLPMKNCLIEKVIKLNFPFGDYALFGSAPMFVRGLREEMHDVDIVVTEKLWQKMQTVPGWKMETASSGDPVLRFEEYIKAILAPRLAPAKAIVFFRIFLCFIRYSTMPSTSSGIFSHCEPGPGLSKYA